MVRQGVALFGLGRAGIIHFRNLIGNHRIHLLYVIDELTDKVAEVLASFNQPGVEVLKPSEADRVYADARVTAVFVCSPTFTHEEFVRGALQSGKAVFCEKPVAQTLAATQACYEVAEKHGQPLLCSFNRRFDPSVAKMNTKVKNGDVGSVYRISTCSRDNPVPPMSYLKISGGIFHDCAVHDIDMICWILGEYPCEVYTQAHAHLQEVKDMDDVDTVVIVMKFPSKVITTIDLSRNGSYGYDQRLEVFGTAGMLVSENQQDTRLASYTSTGVTTEPLLYSFPQRYAQSYKAALEHFLNVVEGTEKLDITKSHSMRISEIATACEHSYKEGRPIQMTTSVNSIPVAN